MPLNRSTQTAGDYALLKATNADGPAVWALISSVLRSHAITANEQTTDKDLVDIEGNYWDRKGAFFLLLRAACEEFACADGEGVLEVSYHDSESRTP